MIDFNKALEINFEFINTQGKHAPLQSLIEDYKGTIYAFDEIENASQMPNKITGYNDLMDIENFDTNAFLGKSFMKLTNNNFKGPEIALLKKPKISFGFFNLIESGLS